MAVERIRKRRETYELGRLKLYRDDLEAVARVMTEFGTLVFSVNDEVTGTAPEDFANLREELPERLERMELEAYRGDSAIVMTLGSGAEVVLIEPDIAARGVLTRIEEICAPRRAGRLWWLWSLLAGLAVAMCILVFIVAQGMWQGKELQETVSSAVLPSMLVTVAAVAMSAARIFAGGKDGSGPKDVIINVPRAERPSFGKRLIADGGVSAFWCAVGLILGGVVGYVVNQLPGF